MEYLTTIQKRGKLNNVKAVDEVGAGGANHTYVIENADNGKVVSTIVFQHGPRNEESSTQGVCDENLLEIVRDRLTAFNQGEFSSRFNAVALTHIEEALMWLNRRTEDRLERNVLGTYNK